MNILIEPHDEYTNYILQVTRLDFHKYRSVEALKLHLIKWWMQLFLDDINEENLLKSSVTTEERQIKQTKDEPNHEVKNNTRRSS